MISSANSYVPKKYYLIVFLSALCFRLLLLFAFEWEDHIIDSYDNIAINILKGIGFSYNGSDPTVCRAPGYPIYLSIIFYIFGHQPVPFFILRILDLILDSMTAITVLWLSALWFSKLHRSYKLCAALVYALNPFSAYYALKLGAETLYVFLFCVYLGLLYKVLFQKKFGILGILALGICGGILLLNKSIFLPLVVITPVLLYLIFPHLRNKEFMVRSVLTVLISFLILTPWAIRNTRVANRFVPVQTLTGYIFWYDFTLDQNRNSYIAAGKFDKSTSATGFITLDNGDLYYPYNLDAREDAAYDKEMINKGFEWIVRHPHKFMLKIVDNLFAFWYFVETPKKMITTAIFSLAFILFALRGTLLCFSQGLKLEPVFFLILIVLIDLIYSPIVGVFRHSLLTYPLLSTLSGPALYSIVPHKKGG